MPKRFILLILVVFMLTACSAKNEGKKADENLPVENELADSLQTVKPVVTFLELGAESCIPCKMMKPVMKDIATDYQGLVEVIFHDLYKDRSIGQKYSVRVMPTQVFLDQEGREFFRHEGFYPKEEIEKMLAEKAGLKKPKSNDR